MASSAAEAYVAAPAGTAAAVKCRAKIWNDTGGRLPKAMGKQHQQNEEETKLCYCYQAKRMYQQQRRRQHSKHFWCGDDGDDGKRALVITCRQLNIVSLCYLLKDPLPRLQVPDTT